MTDALAMKNESEVIANVRRAANRAVSNPADQEDLAQETLLRIWQRDPAQLDGRGGGDISAARGLIRAILRLLRIDLWRRRGGRRPAIPRSDADAIGQPDELARDEVRALVRGVVEQLPPVQREAVRLRFREGMSFQAIADAQGVPLNTALGRVHDAIKRMRQQLETQDGPHEQD